MIVSYLLEASVISTELGVCPTGFVMVTSPVSSRVASSMSDCCCSFVPFLLWGSLLTGWCGTVEAATNVTEFDVCLSCGFGLTGCCVVVAELAC